MVTAINYVQNHWHELTRFINDGRIDLDTNPVEPMFKPNILSRKNALFMVSDEGALAWGIHVSIIEICKLNEVNAPQSHRMIVGCHAAARHIQPALSNAKAVRECDSKILSRNHPERLENLP